VEELGSAEDLPCRVELADFFDYRIERRFDGAVLMGSLEHLPACPRVARLLARHLRPGARVWADFGTSPEGRLAGAFLRRHVFPGVSGYVDVPALLRAFERSGLRVLELRDAGRARRLRGGASIPPRPPRGVSWHWFHPGRGSAAGALSLAACRGKTPCSENAGPGLIRPRAHRGGLR
jgi:hypothetical protein